jgi:protein TonB
VNQALPPLTDRAIREPTSEPPIGPNERLSATLALSSILFGVMILGIGFAREDAAPVAPTLDVILTQTTTAEAPKQADFIAQANNQGGGDRDTAQRPREAQIASVPKPQPGIAPEPILAQAPFPATDPQQRLLTTLAHSEHSAPPPEDRAASDPRPLPTSRQLMEQSLEMARLAAEIERQQELYAKRPKRKFISASTQQYEYAAYMRAWVEKVERVGNLNYPEQARRQGLSGRLIMTVAVRRDGSVEGITLVQPSEKKLLDEAAVGTVRLAEPFPALPKTEENIDVLHITRTWDFKNGNVGSE